MKYEITDTLNGGYQLYRFNDDKLISIGDLILYKEEQKFYSHCSLRSSNFHYHDISNPFNSHSQTNFTPERIQIIQMK